MSRLVVSEYVTLDGVMQDPGGGEKSEHGGWSFRFWSDEAGAYKFEELKAAGALLLGRVTYQAFAAAWPGMAEQTGEYGAMMNGYPKYVASRTLETTAWNASLIKGDLAAEVSKLKQQPGKDILVFGSGELVQTLMQHDLVDEYRLMVHPVVLGSGMKVLKPVETKTFSSGIVVLHYQPMDATAA